jgi:hypothetical protein
MKLRVDHAASIAEATYVTDFPTAEAISKLFEAFEETPSTPSYDWLIDVRAITSDVSKEELLAAARTWNRLAKGRDVGRRTAIVCNSAVLETIRETLANAMSFRFVGVFSDRKAALIWLKNPKILDEAKIQFI